MNRTVARFSGEPELPPVFLDETGIRRDGVFGKNENFSLVGFELRLHRLVGQEGLEAIGKKQAEIGIECDESLIESGIVEAVEGDAVADVEAFRFVAPPWEDVRSDQEFADRQAGNGAAVVVIVEHDIAEVVLAAALFRRPRDYGLSGRRLRHRADAGAGNDLGGFRFGFIE